MTLPLAAVLGWLFTGGFLALARRRNWGKAIRAKGPEGHKVKEGTPTLGGVAFLAAAVGCWALIGPHSLESAVVVALVLASGLLGLLDDLLALRRRGEETTGPVSPLPSADPGGLRPCLCVLRRQTGSGTDRDLHSGHPSPSPHCGGNDQRL